MIRAHLSMTAKAGETARRASKPRSCPICCDDLDGDDTCSFTPWFARLLGRGNGEVKCKTCNNCFHSSCVDKWFSASGQRQCPLCRQPWDGVGAASGEVGLGNRGEIGGESGRPRLSHRMMMTSDPRPGWVSLPTSVLSQDIEEYDHLPRSHLTYDEIVEALLRQENLSRELNVASGRISQQSPSDVFDSQWRTRQYLQLDQADSPTFVDLSNARDDHVRSRPMSSNVRHHRQQSPRSVSSLQPSHLRSWQPVDTEPNRDDRDLELSRPPRIGSASSDAHGEAVSSFNRPPRHPYPSVWDRKDTIGIGYRQAIPPRRRLSQWTLDDPCPILEWL